MLNLRINLTISLHILRMNLIVYSKKKLGFPLILGNQTKKSPQRVHANPKRVLIPDPAAIRVLTRSNSVTRQGMVIPPWWWNPNSSSASFSNSPNRGWLKYITGTRTRCNSPSSSPTYTAKCPFGTFGSRLDPNWA